MVNFEQQISQRVHAFIAEITELARKQAIETLSTALTTGAVRGPRAGNGRRRAAPVSGSGGRRSADEIETTCTALLAEIGSTPGRRIEQIGEALAMRTKDLALPMRKLIKERRVRTEGQRRATRYFVGGGGGGGAAARRRGGRKRKAAAAD